MCGSHFSIQSHHPSVNSTSQMPRSESVQPQGQTSNVLPMTAEQRMETKEISVQLHHLLQRVANRATIAVDLSDIRAAFQNNPHANLDSVEKALTLATNARASLLALDSYSGKEIAQAFRSSFFGGVDWRGDVGNKVKAAINAQSALSEELLNLSNDSTLDPEVRNLISEKYLQSCCRESELATVLMNMVEIGGKGKTTLTAEDQQALSKSFSSWMAETSKGAHGTQEAFNPLKSTGFATLENVLKELDGNDTVMNLEMRTRLQSAITEAEAQVKSLLGNETIADKNFFRETLKVLEQAKASMASLRETVVDQVLTRHVNECLSLPANLRFSEQLLQTLERKGACPNIAKLSRFFTQVESLTKAFVEAKKAHNAEECEKIRNAFKALQKEMHNFVASMTDYYLHPGTHKSYSRLEAEGHTLDVLVAEEIGHHDTPPIMQLTNRDAIRDIFFSNATSELIQLHTKGSFESTAAKLQDAVMSLNLQLGTLNAMFDRMELLSEESVNTKEILRGFLYSEAPISTLIETRVNGITDEDINTQLCDANIRQCNAFGHGQVNAVYDVKLNDGNSYIFKAEVSGRTGINVINAGRDGYEDNVNVAAINVAAHKAASFFGVGDRIVSGQIGVCNGQLGLYMEKAKGCDALNFRNLQANKGVDQKVRDLGIPNLKNLPTHEFLKANGQLMKQCYDLEWTDFLIGSCDRHKQNYMIHVDEHQQVSLKGIDNDASFGRFRPGFSTISFAEDQAMLLLGKAISAIHTNTGEKLSANDLVDELEKMQGVEVGSDKNERLVVRIDLAKVKEPWLKELAADVRGLHQLVPPMVIDQKIYDRLMEIDQNPNLKEEYRNMLANRLGERNVKAAMLRLDGAIQHAKELAQKNRVIQDWNSLEVQREVYNINLANKQIPEPDKSTKMGKINHRLNTGSYTNRYPERLHYNLYVRDFGDVLGKHLMAIKA